MYWVLYRREQQWGGRPRLKSIQSDLLWLISVPAHPFRGFTHCCQPIRNGFSRWSSSRHPSSSRVKLPPPLFPPCAENPVLVPWLHAGRGGEGSGGRARGGWESPPFYSILMGWNNRNQVFVLLNTGTEVSYQLGSNKQDLPTTPCSYGALLIKLSSLSNVSSLQ